MTECIAYEQLEPAWEEKISYQLALLTATIVNVVQGALVGAKAKHVKPSDFIPEWDPGKGKEPAKEQTIDEMKEVFKLIAQAHKKPPNITPPSKRKRRAKK